MIAAAVIAFALFAVMRAKEPLKIRVSADRLQVSDSAIVAKIHDKTHTDVWRQLLWEPSSLLSDERCFAAAVRRARRMLRSATGVGALPLGHVASDWR